MSTSQHVDPLIGRLVDGRYRVRARIARGGMATVYVATDLRLERRVALKVMHGHLSDDAVFQSRFIQEARAAARLADPHVVNVFDQGQDDDMAYLVMEYLPGITLRDLLREQRRLTVPQAVTIMDAVVSGLAAAHRSGIVHRDVKPENILLAEDGRIKIGDFGLARATTANTATGQMLLGTIAYLAPELVTRGTADARSDIYSLGIVLYEMLTGEQPYKGEQPMQIAFQHATDSVPRPSVKNPAVPEQLDEIVLWATERAPDDRPRDANELLTRLRDVERDLGIAPQVARTLAVSTGAIDRSDSNELTAVLPSTGTAPTATVGDVDNATRLRRRTQRRAASGGWLFALVLLLAALAAGTGWWFGSGPGSMVPVPDVSGRTFDEAQQLLADQTLKVTQTQEFSLGVAAGAAIRTDPATGVRVAKDSTVTVVMSQGPQPHDIAALAGVAVDQARNQLTAAGVQVGDDAPSFTDASPNTVIAASITPRGGGDAFDCTNGCSLHEGDSAVLSVSLGPVPDVTGESEGSARSILDKAQLLVADDVDQDYSGSVAKDKVIGIAARDGGGDWKPGETVTLVVSKGPQPIAVPDVSGRSVGQAIDILTKAGFEPTTNVPELVWGLFTATSTDPAAGSLQLPGTKIQVRAAG